MGVRDLFKTNFVLPDIKGKEPDQNMIRSMNAISRKTAAKLEDLKRWEKATREAIEKSVRAEANAKLAEMEKAIRAECYTELCHVIDKANFLGYVTAGKVLWKHYRTKRDFQKFHEAYMKELEETMKVGGEKIACQEFERLCGQEVQSNNIDMNYEIGIAEDVPDDLWISTLRPHMAYSTGFQRASMIHHTTLLYLLAEYMMDNGCEVKDVAEAIIHLDAESAKYNTTTYGDGKLSALAEKLREKGFFIDQAEEIMRDFNL